MQAQFGALAKTMETARSGVSVTDNAAAYSKQLQQVQQLRPAFNQLMQATNGFTVETVKSVSASQALSKSIMDGKIKVGDAIGNFTKFKQTLREVANEQAALSKATAVQWTNSSTGKSMVDLYMPTNAVATAQQRMGVYLNALKAGSTAIQDWGKNTQWAGRQITAGFTMPLALAATGLVALAKTADQQLTRITKVMNTTTVSDDPWVQQQSNLQQYAAARDAAMQTGVQMAKTYGAALTDTLGLEADLAALGKQGNDLQATTVQVTRLATLGELDYNTALKTSIALMNAFHMSTGQMGDAFNYMNALENNTSLSMADFAKAIPVAANAMSQLGVSFQQFGTLMVAGQAGGVGADQMANALKSATGRILAPSKATISAFKELNVDIKQEVKDSGANLMDLLNSLGKKLANSDPLKRMTAIKDLFGTYQYGKMSTVLSNLMDASANPDDPNNQTAVAEKIGKQDPGQWAQIANQEISQFQQSASGKLRIATSTLKAQLTSLGAPVLNMITPIVSGLASIVTVIQKIGSAIPDPLKKLGTFLAIGAALMGPIAMIIGIGANAVGTIGKVLAAMGLWTNGTKMQTKEQAAQTALMRETLTATTEAAQSTGDLATKMQEVVAIMEERIAAQQKLNELTEQGVVAETQAAEATATNAQATESAAQATIDVATADTAATTAGDLNIKSIRDQIIAWRELGEAERQAAADAAAAAGASVTGITGARIGTGGFAVNSSGQATYSAKGSRAASLSGMLDQNGYDASLGYGIPTSAANGTSGRGFSFGNDPVRNGLVGLRGPSGTPNAAINAANWRRMLDSGSLSEQARNAASASSIAANYSSLVNPKSTINLGPAAALASRNIVTSTERTLMDELVRISEAPVTSTVPGARARLAAIATRLNPFNGIKSGDPTGFIGPQLPVAGQQGFIGPLTAAQTSQAAKDAEKIAQQSEKAGMSWGKIAGNVGALAMGGMMVKDMADGSGNIATNILEATMAASMLLPVGGQLVNVFKTMKASAAAVGESGAASAGLMGAGFGKVWDKMKGGLSAVGSAAKWLFTTGPGLFTFGLTAAAIAFYAINEQMTKIARQQEKINQSTTAWQQILGYTSKATVAADGSIAQGTNAYIARRSAVDQLTKANQSLVDGLQAAANAKDGKAGSKADEANTYNLAMTEALKVKVDGGTTQQAKMAFDVALQAAGFGQQTIDKLDVKFNEVKLDDPNGLSDAINKQIGNSLKQGTDGGFHMDGGWWNSLWNATKDQLSNGSMNGWSELGDQAKGMFEKVGSQVWQGIAAGLNSNNKGEIDNTMKSLTTGINTSFQESFGKIQSDNKELFSRMGISTMTDLNNAYQKAMQTAHKSGDQKSLIDALDGNQQFQEYQNAWKVMLTAVGTAAGKSRKELDNFVNKTMTINGLEGAFTNNLSAAASATKGLGDAFQQAADGAASLADAMNTQGAIATGAQYAQEMQQAFGGAMADYTKQASEAFQKQQQAAANSIQAGGDKKVKSLQDSQKAQDAIYAQSDKNITDYYKNIAAQYDGNVKAKQDEAKAETDAIQSQMDALKKEDTTRQDLFNAEKTRLQRMAQLQTNNIDFNAALNSGNLDEAARVYANNQSQVQGNMLDDQQAAMDKVSKAAQDSLQGKIDAINTERDTYVQAQQDMKSALADREQADHDSIAKQKQAYDDAMQAQIDSTNKATQASIAASNERYQKDKEYIDMQVQAATAAVPMTVQQARDQMSQINGLYGQYGQTLGLYTKAWSDKFDSDLQLSMLDASNALQNQIGWSQMGTFIQGQIDSGAAFTLDQALSFLKTGQWPTGIGGSESNAASEKPWVPTAAYVNGLKEKGLGVNTKYNIPGAPRASHSGGLAGSGPEGLNFKNRVGVSPSAPMMPSEYLTLLRQGEFVVNKQATEQNRGILEAINNGDYIARHSGGSVGGIAAAGGEIVGRNAVLHAGVMMQAAKEAVTQAYGQAQMTQMYSGKGLGADVSRFFGKGNSINDTLQFAKSQQGKPYIWGGTGAGGQDCSGFMSVLYNFLAGGSPKGNSFPWGRDWVTQSFEGGREFGPWKRDSRSSGHKFRIGVLPNSHMAGTLGGYHVESGSGHGPMVGGKALGADDKMFPYQYYLPLADLPQLRTGGIIQYDNTLANLHKNEAVLTAPLTEQLMNNVANGGGASYNVENLNVYGASSQIDFEKGVYNVLVKLDDKSGRSRTVS